MATEHDEYEEEGMDMDLDHEVDELDAAEPEGDEGDDEGEEAEQAAAAPAKEAPSAVPLSVLLEERDSHRAQMSKMEERLRRYDALEQRLEEFQRAREQQEQEPVPEFDVDPTGNLNHRLAEMQKIIDKQNEELQGVRTTSDQHRAMTTLTQTIQTHESGFVQEHPDYYNALNHIREIRRAEYEPLAKARGMTDEQLNQQLMAGELQIAAQLLQAGVNPAEYAYQMAQKYGYKPQEPQLEGEDELDRLRRGVRNSRSLGPGGGKSGKPKRTMQDLGGASLEEWDAAMSEMFGGH